LPTIRALLAASEISKHMKIFIALHFITGNKQISRSSIRPLRLSLTGNKHFLTGNNAARHRARDKRSEIS
jgi:hypothetical protein